MSPTPEEAAAKPTDAAPAEATAPAPAAAPASPVETAAPAAPNEAGGPAGEGDGAPAGATPASTTAAPAAEPEPPPAAPSAAPPAEPLDPFPDRREPVPANVVLYTVFVLLCTGVALWLVFAWAGYKEKYSQLNEGWRLGSTRMIEITLIKEDKRNLACASDRMFGQVRCGYHRDGKPFAAAQADADANVLQPFNTVKNELFLAAGLWQSPVLKEPLPEERFTVVCNYNIIGVLKAVATRWSPTGTFGQADQSIAVGTVSDCTIPQ
jgi:hypothetical protein